MTIKEIRQQSAKILSFSPTASLDADVLVGHILHKDRTFLLFHQDDEISEDQYRQIHDFIEKRRTGLPVAYITGHKEFYGYDFLVSPSVLIPKPDTELLVETAAQAIADKISARPSVIPSVCDMCAGSGCVGISILKTLAEDFKIPNENLPKITFCDISEAALTTAKENARRLLTENQLGQTRFIQTNLFEAVSYTFDLIATNPPYIPHSEAVDLLKDGRSEPLLALDGDVSLTGDSSGADDGLGIIRNLLPQAYAHLAPGGILIMETGEYNADEAAALAEKNRFGQIKILTDLSGQKRDIYAVKR